MRKMIFTTNGFDHPHIGYTIGHRWNGWATPNFELDEATAIMHEYNECTGNPMWYDETTDTFRVAETEYTDADEWKGRNCHTEDGMKHLYGIGSCSWTWEDVTSQDIDNVAQQVADFIWEYDTYEGRNQYGDQYNLADAITEQLQDLSTLKRVITAYYVEDLSGEALYATLGGILNV